MSQAPLFPNVHNPVLPSSDFIIPRPDKKVNVRTLVKGYGLPLAKRALLGLSVGSVEPIDEPDLISNKFGLPIYDTLFIERPNFVITAFNDLTQEYYEVSSTSLGIPVSDTLGGVTGLLIENCIIEVSQSKNIVTTAISGGQGTVKEYIALGDYYISIRGFFASDNPEVYPREKVSTLIPYLSYATNLNIVSSFLNKFFGVNSIVVQNFRLWQQEGMRNIQYFEIQALSDFDNEIQESSNEFDT